ncbi:hypothetical protein EHO61_07685 [Leptospira fluminis]|uniref:Uncharacterized protein n=1 Tax=Leptospira fluminis TaxID=2484979 RepID=A0A4R9GS10_9LEPT|nr:hypothetical protein [Leptospira fluminis]TGK19344.1 hypothetical protein EHO61_07685 [Leptospira fluminis]
MKGLREHFLSFEDSFQSKFRIRILAGKEDKIGLNRLKEFNDQIHKSGGYDSNPLLCIDFDPWSTWIYVTDEKDKILSVQRIVEKTKENLLPVELAVILEEGQPKRYAVLEEGVADWNCVSFERSATGWKAAVKNFSAIAKLCLYRNYSKVYGFYNKEVPAIERIYKSNGAVESRVLSGDVYLPNYHINGNTVSARIIELDKTALQSVAMRL